MINIKYLGDLVVSTPGIRSLSKAYPDSEVVLLVRKGFESIFEKNPFIKKIISFDPELKGNSSVKKFLAGLSFIINLRREKFDVVIVLHPGDRTAFWAWCSGAKIRIAPANQSFSFLFNRKIYVEENSISYLDYYNRIISSLGVTIDSNRTEIFLPGKELNYAKNFFKRNNFDENNIIVGIHPGASEPSKIWKTENFIQLINKLLCNNLIRIIVFEGPQDKKACSVLFNEFSNNTKIAFLKTDIMKVAAVISRCNLFIVNDTGTRHVSVAVGTPVLALMPQDYEKCWSFYTEETKHYILTGKRILDSHNSKPFLDGITAEEVYNYAGKILKLW